MREQPLTAAIAVIDQADASESTELLCAKARALVTGYHHHRYPLQYEPLATEEEFVLPVVNPATGAASRTWRQAGKRDGRLVDPNGRQYLLERKTTSDDIADPNSTFWRRLAIDAQVSMYMLSQWQDGRKLDGTVYDVIRKPTIRPKQVPVGLKSAKAVAEAPQAALRGTRREIEQFGTYYGVDVVASDLDATQETPALYGARLLDDCLAHPEKYYAQRIVPRLDADLLEFAHELWDVGRDIAECRRHNRHYRNSGACMTWNRPCDYLGLCSGYDSEDSDNWTRRDDVHGELETVDGKDVLTHSRIRCFQTCRRKHYYRYELGLVRADKEEEEALWFGSLIHAALEAWTLSQKEDGHGDSNLAGSALASCDEAEVVTR